MVLQMIKSILIECADSTFPGMIGVRYMVFIDFETSIFLWKQNKHRQANRECQDYVFIKWEYWRTM